MGQLNTPHNSYNQIWIFHYIYIYYSQQQCFFHHVVRELSWSLGKFCLKQSLSTDASTILKTLQINLWIPLGPLSHGWLELTSWARAKAWAKTRGKTGQTWLDSDSKECERRTPKKLMWKINESQVVDADISKYGRIIRSIGGGFLWTKVGAKWIVDDCGYLYRIYIFIHMVPCTSLSVKKCRKYI